MSATVNVAADAAADLPTSERRDPHPAERRGRFNFQTKLLAPVMFLFAVAVAVGLFRYTRTDDDASDFASPSPRARTTQLTNTGHVLRAAVSPDGKYVAYVQSERGQESLWVRQVEIAGGSEQRQLTTTAGANFEPTVSDDGRTVVYVSKAADAAQNLWRMNLDNGGRAQLTNGGFDLRPDISPDGRWVVYMSVIKDSPTLWKTPIDGGGAPISK